MLGVDLTPRGILTYAKSPTGQKWLRYSAVSLVGMSVSQILIIILSSGLHVRGVPTNIIAVAVSSVPAYYLNRAWVWGKRGKSHLTKEVVPFWAFAFTGLVLSTVIVALIVPHHPRGYVNTPLDTLRVMFGNLAGFGVLWVARFFVLDRLLFGPHHHLPDVEVAEDEAVADTA